MYNDPAGERACELVGNAHPECNEVHPVLATLELLGIPCFLVRDDGRAFSMTTSTRTHPLREDIECWIEGSRRLPIGDDSPYTKVVRAAKRGGWHPALVKSKGNQLLVQVRIVEAIGLSSSNSWALVLPGLSSIDQKRKASVFQRLHGLTEAEQSILNGLVQGMKPKQIARERDVSQCTVRTQIRSVLSKARARSVSELLAQISELPPVFPSDCGGSALRPYGLNRPGFQGGPFG